MSDLPKNETTKEPQATERSAESLAASLAKFLKNWWGSPRLDVESHLKATLEQYGRQERDRALRDTIGVVEAVASEAKLVGWADECIKRIKTLEEQENEYSENNAPRSGAW